MPVKEIKQINKNSWWGTWFVTEEIGWFFMNLDLKVEDREELDQISNHYKKLEWLATRVMTKFLAEESAVGYRGIYKDSHGKPHLRERDAHISVTHSYPYVSVILHKTLPVGIDLEKVRQKVLQIAPRFLSEQEMGIADHNVLKTTLLWCAKESLYKLHGRKFVVFKEDLEIEPFELNGQGSLVTHIKLEGEADKYDLHYEINDEYMVTYTVRDSQA